MAWSTADIGDLSGRTAVVTGASSGIGVVEARERAAHGARVILAVRNVAAGEAAAAGMPGSTEVRHLDLASLRSVAAFADSIDSPVDLLINNAGVMEPPRWRATEDGHELQFGTNHLGHAALTAHLLPQLLAAPAPRVTTVSSIAHHRGDEHVVDGNPAEGYRSSRAYGQSKLANLLFARELHRRATQAGSALVSTAAHPGVAVTGLMTSPDGMGSNWLVRTLGPALMRWVVPGPDGGAQAILLAATAAEPGSYSGPQGPGEIRGRVGPARLSRWAADDDLAAALWVRTEELLGIPLPF